jgi:hypothetical protein
MSSQRCPKLPALFSPWSEKEILEQQGKINNFLTMPTASECTKNPFPASQATSQDSKGS